MGHIDAVTKRSCLALMALLLVGCTEYPYKTRPPGDAFETARAKFGYPDPTADGEDPLRGTRVVALCYGRPLNDEKDLLEEAALECPHGGRVRLIGQDSFWNGCSAAQPVRATFLCWPGEAPPSPYQ